MEAYKINPFGTYLYLLLRKGPLLVWSQFKASLELYTLLCFQVCSKCNYQPEVILNLLSCNFLRHILGNKSNLSVKLVT